MSNNEITLSVDKFAEAFVRAQKKLMKKCRFHKKLI